MPSLEARLATSSKSGSESAVLWNSGYSVMCTPAAITQQISFPILGARNLNVGRSFIWWNQQRRQIRRRHTRQAE